MLDNRDTADFQSLCQSVVSLRLYFSIPENLRHANPPRDVSEFFHLTHRLGVSDVNEMMRRLIQRSHRPLARTVKSAAERLYSAVRKTDPKSAGKFSIETGRLSYYEAYLLLHWRGREDAFSPSFNDNDIARLDTYGAVYSDQPFNAWIRRKQQGALLHFAASLRSRRVPLAGANIISMLADSSIRDFLEIMGEIYEQYVVDRGLNRDDPSSLIGFATSRTAISYKVQNDGIFAASESYFQDIAARPDIDSDVIARLVSGLGYFTSLLQSNPADARVFRVAERGVFLVDYPPPVTDQVAGENAFVAAAIRHALLAGYLRIYETPRSVRASQYDQISKPIAFRLHRRFAPNFRFSYRGVYEVVRLSPGEISDLCLKPEDMSPFAWAKNMAGVAGRLGDQIVLPFLEAQNGDD